MTYQVLARKWRPKNFAEVVGQNAVVKTLSNAFNQNRLHHAYLLTGTRGVGKTTLGRIIAKCLNCETGCTATPCGQCTTCQEIDQGNFVDLFEIDAASRTKVEDTHDLLNNVPYAPTRGRYKIYLIDEVHMLSNHSFNALLKTLEEPPEHVKFILATTDPQKLPITILSRCLQFHLRNLLPEEIANHLQFVLTQENISFEFEALTRLAHAAEGSMRDALSLLDQAIAYCQNSITTQDVNQMLGITDTSYLFDLLDALSNHNAEKLLQLSQQLQEQGLDYSALLMELLSVLHELAWTQQHSAFSDNQAIQTYAKKISKENLQLYYQIALIGKRDLPLAPTAKIGFEMILLRMLSFTPVKEEVGTEKPKKITAAKVQTPDTVTNRANDAPTKKSISTENQSWHSIYPQLQLSGLTKILAANCTIKSITQDKWILLLDANQAPLLNPTQEQRIQQALSDHLEKSIQLRIEIAKEAIATPAKEHQEQENQQQHAAVSAITQDENVQNLLKSFNANIDLNTVKAIHKEEK